MTCNYLHKHANKCCNIIRLGAYCWQLKRYMNTNKATKKQAAELIRRATKDGWNRKIETMLEKDGAPWNVQVSLTKRIYFANGYINLSSHVIVSFRKTRRGWVPSIAVPNGSKTFRGLWNGNYALQTMHETADRQAQRDAERAAVAA